MVSHCRKNSCVSQITKLRKKNYTETNYHAHIHQSLAVYSQATDASFERHATRAFIHSHSKSISSIKSFQVASTLLYRRPVRSRGRQGLAQPRHLSAKSRVLLLIARSKHQRSRCRRLIPSERAPSLEIQRGVVVRDVASRRAATRHRSLRDVFIPQNRRNRDSPSMNENSTHA